MTGSAKEHSLVLRQQLHVQPFIVDCEAHLCNCYVDLTSHDALDQHRPVVHRQIHPYSRIPTHQPSDGGAHRDFGWVGTSADPQQPGFQSEGLLQVAIDVPGLDEQRPCLRNESFADRGGHHTSPIAIEQLCADRFLQHLDAAGQRRLSETHGLGCPRKAAMLVECQDMAQLAQVDRHDWNLSSPML